LFEQNSQGKIDLKELKKSFESLEIDKNNLTYKNILKEINNLISQNKDGITFEEFVDIFAADEPLEPGSKEEIKKLFDLFVNDPNSNVITFESLKRVNIELGKNMSDEEIMNMIKVVSKNEKKEITFEEFYEYMKKQ